MTATRTAWHIPRYGRPDILTALWLQRMVAPTAGDTVELQGNFRVANGFFVAAQSSFWFVRIG